MGPEQQATLVIELQALRDSHRRNLEELEDPSMKLFHERNGGLEEATEPQVALARATIDQLDRVIAAFNGEEDSGQPDTPILAF